VRLVIEDMAKHLTSAELAAHASGTLADDRALEHIESAAARTPMAVPATQASAWIHNPLAETPSGRGQQANARASSMARRFSTHPPTEERIRRLRQREWAS